MLNPQNDPREARLQQIRARWKQFPGSAPGGTGPTGLMSNDAQGWSSMLNEQTEAANLSNEMAGKPPLSVRRGRDLGGMPASLADSPEWWLLGDNNGSGDAQSALSRIPQSVVSGRPGDSLAALDRLRQKKRIV